MPIDVPASPKVSTHIYDNFKGVDFTNDSTNVWHRRSPSAVNMLPDASGRPFKRHGWTILLSQEDICTALGVDECTIYKCSYFELAGVDHIVVFTDEGVLFYNEENKVPTITATTTDIDCYSSYDRCFFFEGGGTSAFYIYGNYRMWRYGSDFNLEEITDELYVPAVIIGANADGTGTLYESYNLLYNKAKVQYGDYELFTHWGTKGLYYEVNDADFKTAHAKPSPTYYHWKYDNGAWTDMTGLGTAFDSTNIAVPSPKQDDEIVIVFGHALMIPNNIDINSQTIEVHASLMEQFSEPIDVVTVRTDLESGKCLLHQDSVKRDNPQAWVEFDPDDVYETTNGDKFKGEDTFEIIFPSTMIVVTQITESADISPASLVGGDD